MVEPKGRNVVLICGPPGAGKTTLAHELADLVFDRDDPRWRSEGHFLATIKQLAAAPDVSAAVIRSGARAATRRQAARLILATQTHLLDVDAETCIRRIQARGRQPIAPQIAGVRTWWRTYDADRQASAGPRKYGKQHEAERERWRPVVEAGEAYCAEPVCLMPTRWIAPGTVWHLSHDPSGTVWIGPSHARCNLAEAARRGNRMRGKHRVPADPRAGRWVL